MADVYISGSITHSPKEWWDIYEKIGKVVKNFGLTAYVPHIQTPQNINRPLEVILKSEDDRDSFHRDVFNDNVNNVENSKLVIAEVSNPSTGMGIELGVAIKTGKPIICLAEKNAKVTAFIMGMAQLGIAHMIRYENEEDALEKLKIILERNFSHLI